MMERSTIQNAAAISNLMPPKILVVGYATDPQTAHQIKTLQLAGADVRVIAPDLTPSQVKFSWDSDGAMIDDHNIGKIHAALIRSLPPIYLDAAVFSKPLDWPDYFYQFCLQRDRADALLSFLLSLESNQIPCWNPPSRAILVRRKPYQFDVIRSLGCSVPETIVTNHPPDAVAFLKKFPDAIVKPAAGGALTLNAGNLPLEDLERIKMAPAIFQRRIRGDDIRVIVIAEKIASAASILVPPDTVDFRGDTEYALGKIKYEEVSLPAEVQQDCLRICKALGYRYGGLDLKRTSEGEFVFLECNNSPIYMDVEYKLGHPITQILAQEILASVKS
jgi:glutathione synthase/RimK-type ligase-like ATP-grasp enzyme